MFAKVMIKLLVLLYCWICFDLTTTGGSTPIKLPSPQGLQLVDAGYHSINVTWLAPYPTNDSVLIGYVVHYVKTRLRNDAGENKQLRVSVRTLDFSLQNLSAGTNYTIFVSADYHHVYENTKTIEGVTLGFGGDNDCGCDPVGTINGTVCDMYTGLCPCGSHFKGQSCDECDDGFFRHPGKECQQCPCKPETSTGNCWLDKVESAVSCLCTKSHSGPLCNQCQHSHYLVNGTCEPCDCNGNTDPNDTSMCDENGVCSNCRYNTTGRNCELCLPGFVGDPIKGTPCLRAAIKSTTLPTTTPTMTPSTRITTKLAPSSTTLHPTSSQPPPAKEYKKVFMHVHRVQAIIGVSIAFLVIVLIICAIVGYRKYQAWRRATLPPFWTIELKEDHESVSFTSMMEHDYQNVDATLLDDSAYYDKESEDKPAANEKDSDMENTYHHFTL